tara:strand:+ start:617 stop:721 length:105 start_codon:yes stop_codon:yes gene_type:complete
MQALMDDKRREIKYVVITMCFGGGAGAAELCDVA